MSSAADTKTTLTWVLKDEVSGPAKGIGSSLGSLISPTTLAVGGIAALTAGLGAMVGSAMEAQKINAQTAAVLKSTGDAAGLTATQVQNLATRISEYSGIDDGAVQAGENLLLTFTNIQDKAGEGNDIFTQATEIMADMATAMGTDMSSQAIQLGKALNDPIAGVGALSRVGVTFTDEQKDMIAAMMEAGDTAGAQAVIMGELTKEFGGSAQAAGDTADGGLAKLGNKLGELAEGIGTALLPFVTDFADFILTDVIPNVEAFGASIQKFMDENFGPFLDMLGAVNDAMITFNVLLGPDRTHSPGGGRPPGAGGHTAPATNILGMDTANPVSLPPTSYRGGRAGGGGVDPWGVYTVGEQGPETLVMGGQGGSIIPGGGGGGVPVVIPVMIDGREVARIADERLYIMLQRASLSSGRA